MPVDIYSESNAMRQLLFKNFISKDKRKAELFLSEHFEQNGIIKEIEQKTVYRIKEILQFPHKTDLDLYLKRCPLFKSSVQRFIVRKRTPRQGTENYFYKTIANQHLVIQDKVVILSTIRYIKRTLIRNQNQELFSKSL